MKIVILGSGNVATHLAVALKALGHEIQQVYSRTYENAVILSKKVDAQPIDKINQVVDTADLYVFSVKDDALRQVINAMPHTRGIWVHTAGSVPMDMFSSRAKEYGVLYPLQTFSKERNLSFKEIPLFIEASSQSTFVAIEDLANSLSNQVHHLGSDKRSYLHLAAVFACNFTNHMYRLAGDIIQEEGVPFDVLKPLILETASKVMEMSPANAQTGPAVRYDEKVMQAHINQLRSPQLKELYTLLSKSIHSFASPSNTKTSE